MAEDKGGVGEVNGTLSNAVELTGIWPKGTNVDDSGTESGEDLRLINPQVMQEVQSALTRLEGVIPGLEPSKRNAVTQLVTSLQSCLKIAAPPTPPPRKFANKRLLRNRHTVGVTHEELVEARKWADENARKTSAGDIHSVANVFRPVKFVPPPKLEEKYTRHTIIRINQTPKVQKIALFMEPTPQNGILSYVDYDPSVVLFTPEESVQIAVHKAAINKQINSKVRRGSSEDGDVSSADEEKELSTVQRLLQLASESKKTPTKKQKMKRANTIDIPKPSVFDYSSDDYGASADECNRKGSDDMGHFGKRPPSFEPKTENDHKFLSFLQRVNESESGKIATYNPSARGGKHWQNRFSTIKTAFEPKDFTPQKVSSSPSPAKLFWQKSESQNAQNSQKKLPWSVKTQENGVIVGSLTVSKPINNFNHAPKSAFKPIDKKPTTPMVSGASGSVKQIAASKFSAVDPPVKKPKPKIPEKPLETTVTKFYNIPPNITHEIKQKSQEKPKKFIYQEPKNFQSIKPPFVAHKNNIPHSNQNISNTYLNNLNEKDKIYSNITPRLPERTFKSDAEKDKVIYSNYPPKVNSLADIGRNYMDYVEKDKVYPSFSPKENPAFRPQETRNLQLFEKVTYPPKIDVRNGNYEQKSAFFPNIPEARNFYDDKVIYSNYPPKDEGRNYKSRDQYDFKPYNGKVEHLRPEPWSEDITPDESPEENRYLCGIRDASTINTQSEYISNIPATRTVLRDGQYVSITPKSRTPLDDSPLRSPVRSPLGKSPESNVYFNNTRFPNRVNDMTQMESSMNKLLQPSIKVDDYYEEKAVSKVMGQAQRQSAVTVNNRTKTRYDDIIQNELRLQLQHSANKKSLSPSFPNVLQKSESWHQMVKEQMTKAKQAPPLPKISKAKSSHSLALPRQFESAISPETVECKKMTVSQYLAKQQKRKNTRIAKSTYDIDDLDNVDEVFESIFQEANKKRNGN